MKVWDKLHWLGIEPVTSGSRVGHTDHCITLSHAGKTDCKPIYKRNANVEKLVFGYSCVCV